MSAAQRAQQRNRDSVGRYQTRVHGEIDLELDTEREAETLDPREHARVVSEVYREITSMGLDGTPAPVPASMSATQAEEHRAAIAWLGDGDTVAGVQRARELWMDGVQNEHVQALFSGFGDLDEDEREQVMAHMDGSDPYRDAQFWSASVFYASRGHDPIPEVDLSAGGKSSDEVLKTIDYTARVQMARQRAFSNSSLANAAVDADDLASEMSLDLMTRLRAGTLPEVRNLSSVYITIGRRLAYKMKNQGQDQVDVDARNDLSRRVREREDSLDRQLTNAERRELIEQVRAERSNIPKKGAPSLNYHVPGATMSIGASEESEQAGVGLSSFEAVAGGSTRGAGATASAEQMYENEISERALSALEQMREGRSNAAATAATTRAAWNLMAQVRGAPSAVEGSISKRQSTACRSRMKALGGGDLNRGVATAISQWENETYEDEQVVKDLFVAFGEAGEDFEAQEQIVETMKVGGRDRAAVLWSSALTYANRATMSVEEV